MVFEPVVMLAVDADDTLVDMLAVADMSVVVDMSAGADMLVAGCVCTTILFFSFSDCYIRNQVLDFHPDCRTDRVCTDWYCCFLNMS